MVNSVSDSIAQSDLIKKQPKYELEKNYEHFLARYEKEMHESYRLDIKLQDLNMQLEHKVQKLRAKKAADFTQKIRILEHKLYMKQTELSEIQESTRNLKAEIEKLRLDKLATKSHTQKLADFLIRAQSEASLHSRRREKNEFKYDFAQTKIDELARSLTLTKKERSASTARFLSERTSPIKKRFTTPQPHLKPSQTSAPITRILTKKWKRKTIEMNHKLEERQRRVKDLRQIIQTICENENLYTYDQVVLSFIDLFEHQNKLEKQLFILKHEGDLHAEQKKFYEDSKAKLINTNFSKSIVIKGLRSEQMAKLKKLRETEKILATKLQLYKTAMKEVETVISEINSLAFFSSNLLDTNLLDSIRILETRLNEFMTFLKLSKKSPYAITGLLDLKSLHPKVDLDYKINIDLEAGDIEEERPLSLSELKEKSRKMLLDLRNGYKE